MSLIEKCCLQNSKKIFHIVRQQKKEGVVGGGRGREEEGEGLEEEDEIAELEQRLGAAKLPEHALKAAKKELKVQLHRSKDPYKNHVNQLNPSYPNIV